MAHYRGKSPYLDRLLDAVDYDGNSYFYKRIFDQNHNKFFLNRIRQIMQKLYGLDSNYIPLAAEFARKMTAETSIYDNFVDFQNFCSYFEFAVIEMKSIVAASCSKMKDVELLSISPFTILKLYFARDGELIENFKLNNKVFVTLCNSYHPNAAHVDEAVSALSNLYSEPLRKGRNALDEIRAMAKNYKMIFSSTPSAVYHWRKYTTSVHIGDMDQFNAQEYFRQANETVAEGTHEKDKESKWQEAFFHNDKIVKVSKRRPFRLVAFV